MTRSACRIQEVQPGGEVPDRSVRLRQDRTPTEVDQNVLVNVIALNAASWLVKFPLLIHTKLVGLAWEKIFVVAPNQKNLTPQKF